MTATKVSAEEVVRQFLAEAEKRSVNTARGYETDISKFIKATFGKSIEIITVEDFESIDYNIFAHYIESIKKSSNSTVNRSISTIRTLMKYLKARSVIKRDIAYLDLIKLKKNKSVRIDIMPRQVVLNYISEAGKERNHARMKQCLIILAVDTALRLEDLLEIEWSQFSPREDDVVMRGYGKGGDWLEKINYNVYEQLLELKVEGQRKVFAPLSEKNVQDMMNRIKKNLDYQESSYSFHSFKKAAVTFTYRITGDFLEAMKKGKHANPETTMIYLEEENYGATGMFSLGEFDSETYKNIAHEDLLKVIGEMNKDTIHLLNIKATRMKEKGLI